MYTFPVAYSLFHHNFNTFTYKINQTEMANLNRIKVVLVEQQKTGKRLAEQLGKSTCIVSKWCNNTIQPALDKIVTLLNVDIRELLTPSK